VLGRRADFPWGGVPVRSVLSPWGEARKVLAANCHGFLDGLTTTWLAGGGEIRSVVS